MNCKKIREELIFRHFDGEMEQEMRVAYELHVKCCSECAREARYVTRFVTIVRQRTIRATVPVDLRHRLFKDLLRGGICLC
jgi:anti-sigma factor RsiW